MKARKANTLGRSALGCRKKSAQVPIKRIRSLKATEMKSPSQAVPQGSNSLLRRICGSRIKAMGVRKTRSPRTAATVKTR